MSVDGPLPERFEAAGVRALAMTMVDNGGITRVKAVPLSRLERVAANGVGMAYIWAAAGTDNLVRKTARIAIAIGRRFKFRVTFA